MCQLGTDCLFSTCSVYRTKSDGLTEMLLTDWRRRERCVWLIRVPRGDPYSRSHHFRCCLGQGFRLLREKASRPQVQDFRPQEHRRCCSPRREARCFRILIDLLLSSAFSPRLFFFLTDSSPSLSQPPSHPILLCGENNGHHTPFSSLLSISTLFLLVLRLFLGAWRVGWGR